MDRRNDPKPWKHCGDLKCTSCNERAEADEQQSSTLDQAARRACDAWDASGDGSAETTDALCDAMQALREALGNYAKPRPNTAQGCCPECLGVEPDGHAPDCPRTAQAIDIDCPACEAERGQVCRDADGGLTAHAAREAAARGRRRSEAQRIENGDCPHGEDYQYRDGDGEWGCEICDLVVANREMRERLRRLDAKQPSVAAKPLAEWTSFDRRHLTCSMLSKGRVYKHGSDCEHPNEDIDPEHPNALRSSKATPNDGRRKGNEVWVPGRIKAENPDHEHGALVEFHDGVLNGERAVGYFRKRDLVLRRPEAPAEARYTAEHVNGVYRGAIEECVAIVQRDVNNSYIEQYLTRAFRALCRERAKP